MQFYDVIEKRSSIKSYKDKPIDRDKLARMINASMMSPSWKNRNSYKFIMVDDKREREELASTVLNDTEDAADSIKNAPMTAVVVANPSESGSVAGRDYYLVDSAIAMEHFILAATNEGYGTCWIASVDEDKVRQVLQIPSQYRVVGMTPIGEIEKYKKPHAKKDVRNYVFLNKWDKAYTQNDSKFIKQ